MRPHVQHSSYIRITDLFCGAGGSSYGASRVPGVHIYLAMNHWKRAVETHQANFPDIEHVLADIQEVSPQHFGRSDILIASPSCTNHSLAKGRKKQPISPQLELPWDGDEFGPPLPLSAEERSRATMWDPLKWARVHKYNYVILENVVDVRGWTYYQMWLDAWRTLDEVGYDVQVVYWNSQFFHPTPQSRDRWYCIATRRGNRLPKLDYRPQAYCSSCQQFVGAIQSWKNRTKPFGRYGPYRQYLYRCPRCTAVVQPFYYCAANVIDWSVPTPRIGERKKPLKPKTMERIRTGLERFYGQSPFTVQINKSTDRYTRVLTEPLRTQTADNGQALVTPFLLHTSHTGNPENWVYPLDGVAPTQTTRQDLAMVHPPALSFGMNHGPRYRDITREPLPTQTTYDDTGLLVPNAGMLDLIAEYRIRDILAPHSTVCARGNHHALVTFPFIAELHGGGSTARPITEALATVCAGGTHHGLVMPPLPDAFVTTYYRNGQAIDPFDQPMPTATTHDRYGLVTLEEQREQGKGGSTKVDIMECGFRMLEPSEVKRAMAFPDEYKLLGSRREQVKLAGNAVTYPVMEFLVQACVDAMS